MIISPVRKKSPEILFRNLKLLLNNFFSLFNNNIYYNICHSFDLNKIFAACLPIY